MVHISMACGQVIQLYRGGREGEGRSVDDACVDLGMLSQVAAHFSTCMITML